MIYHNSYVFRQATFIPILYFGVMSAPRFFFKDDENTKIIDICFNWDHPFSLGPMASGFVSQARYKAIAQVSIPCISSFPMILSR